MRERALEPQLPKRAMLSNFRVWDYKGTGPGPPGGCSQTQQHTHQKPPLRQDVGVLYNSQYLYLIPLVHYFLPKYAYPGRAVRTIHLAQFARNRIGR